MSKSGNFNQRFILITGTSSGIGKACVLYLSELGFTVFAGVRSKQDGEALKVLTSDRLYPVIPVIMDTTNYNQIQEVFHTIREISGESGLTGLVNNAGIGFGTPIELIPLTDLRRIFEVNVIGNIAVLQTFLPLLRKAGGRIVNITSISGLLAMPFQSTYSATKFALEAFTDALRVELRPWNIPVIAIEPGSINSSIWQKAHSKLEEIMVNASPEGQQLYGETVNTFNLTSQKFSQRGIPAVKVARVVARALTVPKPKTRYLVGTDARLMAMFIRPLPDRMRDVCLAKLLGLPAKPLRKLK